VFDADAGGRAWVGIPSTLLHGLACTVGVRAQLRVQQCTAGDAPAHEWVEADSVIWALAAHAAHGRLPRGTDPRRHLRLRRWPNLTRWLETPGAMTLAAQWSRGASLAWLHRNSGVPCPAINTFYAAGAALDLFEEHGDGASGRWSRMASAASAPSNLLSRLARRLLGRD
jgi:hypothetical protein